MAEGLNRVMLLGNLGGDPELRVTNSGTAILKMRIATTETYMDRNNTRQERTEWHSVSLWGKRGEALSKFLRKGDRIFVEGSLRTSSYEKDGEKRYRTEINAMNVLLAGGRRSGDGDQQETPSSGRGSSSRVGDGRSRAPAREAPPADDYSGFGDYGGGDDDIPF